MNVHIITAIDNNNGIGIDNRLPWRMPSDLAFFKSKTLNQVIVLGRKTLDSLPKILPLREHWVLSKSAINTDKAIGFSSVDAVLKEAKERDISDLWIIGGSMVYEQFLPIATDLWITRIDADVKANRFFPKWNPQDFKLISEEAGKKTEHDQYDFSLFHWKRRQA